MEIIGRRRVYSGRVVSLELVDLRLDEGGVTQQEMVAHAPSVGVIAVDSDGKLLLERQFRSPTGGMLLEIPAGSADAGESMEEAAQRELQEEINRRAGSLRQIGAFYLAPGWCDEFMTIFVAEGLSESSLQADPDEVIEVEAMSLSEALAAVASGEIRDAKTVAALLLYAAETKG
jgi:ADP-ribose pyrophosphatase